MQVCTSSSMQTKCQMLCCQDLAWEKLGRGQAGADEVWELLWESPSISLLSPPRQPG